MKMNCKVTNIFLIAKKIVFLHFVFATMDNIILGIDPGTQILGYSLLEVRDGKPNLILMDVLYLKKIQDYNLRIRKIFDSTVRIIDTYHPDHLAIEAPFFGKNVQSMLKLGRAQGVAIAAGLSRDLPFTEYEPSVIKQKVTGNGNATKEQVLMMLRSILQFPDDPHYLDASDALGVAYTCYLDQNNPLADVRSLLTPAKKHKSKRQSWADFVNQNSDRLKK